MSGSIPEDETPTDDFDPKKNAAEMEAGGTAIAKALLRAEMAKRRLTYESLAALMWDFGIDENERNLRNKVSRGSFSAAWFFSVMMMMEVKSLDFSHAYDSVSDVLSA